MFAVYSIHSWWQITLHFGLQSTWCAFRHTGKIPNDACHNRNVAISIENSPYWKIKHKSKKKPLHLKSNPNPCYLIFGSETRAVYSCSPYTSNLMLFQILVSEKNFMNNRFLLRRKKAQVNKYGGISRRSHPRPDLSGALKPRTDAYCWSSEWLSECSAWPGRSVCMCSCTFATPLLVLQSHINTKKPMELLWHHISGVESKLHLGVGE